MLRRDILPIKIIQRGDLLYRIHHRKYEPNFYATVEGRFNSPKVSPSFGVCYLALVPMACFIEKFGRIEEKPVSISDHKISTLKATSDQRVVELPHSTNLGLLEKTADIYAGKNYSDSRALSEELFDRGYSGIQYHLRHSMGRSLEGIALYGKADEFSSVLEKTDTQEINTGLMMEAEELFRLDLSNSY